MTPMSSTPFLAPPMFLTINPTARPIAELAIFPGLRAPELKLTWISWRIGPLMAKKGAQDPVLTSKRIEAGLLVRKSLHRGNQHRHVRRKRSRHDRIDGDLLDGGLAQSRDDLCHDVIRRQVRTGHHLRHGLFGGRHNRQAIGPAVLIKETIYFFVVSLENNSGRLDRRWLRRFLLSSQRFG